MPRSDDGHDEVKESKTSESIVARKGSDKDYEWRRNLRWVSFARTRVVFGFDHLSPAYIPSMGRKNIGLCLCIDKVSGWRPPLELLNDTDKFDDIQVSVKINVSLYHLNSVTFFGSTWSSEPVPISEAGESLDNDITFHLDEVIYMVSRVNDPSCIVIIEIVALKENADTGMCLGQYGCGWVQLPLFNLQQPPPDIAEGFENVKPRVSSSHYYNFDMIG